MRLHSNEVFPAIGTPQAISHAALRNFKARVEDGKCCDVTLDTGPTYGGRQLYSQVSWDSQMKETLSSLMVC